MIKGDRDSFSVSFLIVTEAGRTVFEGPGDGFLSPFRETENCPLRDHFFSDICFAFILFLAVVSISLIRFT